jgi:hypothetical protein
MSATSYTVDLICGWIFEWRPDWVDSPSRARARIQLPRIRQVATPLRSTQLSLPVRRTETNETYNAPSIGLAALLKMVRKNRETIRDVLCKAKLTLRKKMLTEYWVPNLCMGGFARNPRTKKRMHDPPRAGYTVEQEKQNGTPLLP